jgi:hypothetical protein
MRGIDVSCWRLWKDLQTHSGSGVAMDEIDIPTAFLTGEQAPESPESIARFIVIEII